MRILHVIATLDPDWGGPPMVVTRIACAQAAHGHDVGILSYEAPHCEDTITELFEKIPGHEGAWRETVGIRGLMDRIRASSVTAWCDANLDGVDYMHVHGVWEPILPAAAAAARQRNIPYALIPHGMLDPWCLEQKRLKKKMALMMGYRAMLNGAAFLHMLNRDEHELIEPLRLTPPQEIIPNGIFLEELADLPEPGAFYDAHPELDGTPFILFLSRLHYKKGLDYLADAFAEFCQSEGESHLVVAGPDGGAQEDFEQRIADAGIGDRVHVVGPMYGAMKMAALVDAACFCLPSRQEGFSIAITEALACRLPVVITKACHFPEVEEVNAGRATELNGSAVAQALLEVMGDAELRSSMGEAGHELVKSRYTWSKIGRAVRRSLSKTWRALGMTDESRYSGTVCVQQGVLTDYRAPLFDEVSRHCDGGLHILASKPREHLQIKSADQLTHASVTASSTRVIGRSPLQMYWQTGIIEWLERHDPGVLITEANARYLSSRRARRWMRAKQRPVIGWGLGTMALSRGMERVRGMGRKKFVNGFDALIAYSTRAADEYEQLGFNRERIFIAYNACTMRPPGSMPERPAAFEDRPNILFVGRMVPGKRMDTLLEACAKLPDPIRPRVTLVGDGPERAAAEAVAREIYPDAEFPGGKFGDELAAYFNAADLFVLPGLGGLAIQQAMAHALPVVVADGDGTQFDLIREGRNGWHVTPGDTDQLARVLEEALSDVDALRARGAESWRVVREDINIENMASTFIRAIHSVI